MLILLTQSKKSVGRTHCDNAFIIWWLKQHLPEQQLWINIKLVIYL